MTAVWRLLEAAILIGTVAVLLAFYVYVLGVVWHVILISFQNWRVARSRATVPVDADAGDPSRPEAGVIAVRTRDTTPLLSVQRWCRYSYEKNEAFKNWERRESPDLEPVDPKFLKPVTQVIPSEAKERMDLLHWPENLEPDSPWKLRIH